MKLLIVTEKCGIEAAQRDGGARLVTTLQQTFGEAARVMQFGDTTDPSAWRHFAYPHGHSERFLRRLANSGFIAERVREVAAEFSHVLFVHVSMQFGIAERPLDGPRTWTFPMFLTPSYAAAGEAVPTAYTEAERRGLAGTGCILTPSHMERDQLVGLYGISGKRVRVVPRGVATRDLCPRVRVLIGQPRFVSVGSIKRQKNTLGLVRLFAKIRTRWRGATLRIVGPVQNPSYAAEVYAEIARLGLVGTVEFSGYATPSELASKIDDCHIHLSTSTCETFGRSIFETLAAGLPNVGRASGNAAAKYLAHLPSARFVDDDTAAVEAVSELLTDLPAFSAAACEVGELFDDDVLGRLLAAEVSEADVLAVADYDGTIFHKGDLARTTRCAEAFRRFRRKVVCSARSIPDLLDGLRCLGIDADWIVGCSGGVVSDGEGRTLWTTPLDAGHAASLASVAGSRLVLHGSEVLQVAMPADAANVGIANRVEVYQGTAFVGPRRASKLRAVVRLLRHVEWRGRVRAFGDGPHDREFLEYFDGTRIGASYADPHLRQAAEIEHE